MLKRILKKLIPYLAAGTLSMGIGSCKNEDRIGTVPKLKTPSLEQVIDTKSLTVSPLQFHHYSRKQQSEIINDVTAQKPRKCVLAEDIKKDLDQRTDDLFYIVGKVPKVGGKTKDILSFSKKVIIDVPYYLTKQLEKAGIIKDTCPAFQTWSGDYKTWNISPSSSLRIYKCLSSVSKEICDDGFDNDCDGDIDDRDSDCEKISRRTRKIRKVRQIKIKHRCNFPEFTSKSKRKIGRYLGIPVANIEKVFGKYTPNVETTEVNIVPNPSISYLSNTDKVFDLVTGRLERNFGKRSGRYLKIWDKVSNGCDQINVQKSDRYVTIQLMAY